MARALVDVRRAGPDDLADVLLLWAQGRDEMARLGRPPVSVEQIGQRLTDAIAAGQIELLIARREGRAAGFLVFRETPLSFMVDQPSISVDQIYVAVGERRHGVARAMLGQVAVRAERAGAEQIVSSVTPWARDTHRFFARLGFAPVIVRRSVSPSVLRRRLGGEAHRGALEDLLSRRRSLRARARRSPTLAILGPDDAELDQLAALDRLDPPAALGDGSARPA